MQCNRILRSVVMWNRAISNGSAVLKRSTHSATSSSSIMVGTTSSSSPYRAQQNRSFSTVMKPAEEEQVINMVILYIYIYDLFSSLVNKIFLFLFLFSTILMYSSVVFIILSFCHLHLIQKSFHPLILDYIKRKSPTRNPYP